MLLHGKMCEKMKMKKRCRVWGFVELSTWTIVEVPLPPYLKWRSHNVRPQNDFRCRVYTMLPWMLLLNYCLYLYTGYHKGLNLGLLQHLQKEYTEDGGCCEDNNSAQQSPNLSTGSDSQEMKVSSLAFITTRVWRDLFSQALTEQPICSLPPTIHTTLTLS